MLGFFRLDADEVPSTELKNWLQAFRCGPEPTEFIAGYTCILAPLEWSKDCDKVLAKRRIFLFHKRSSALLWHWRGNSNPDGKFEALQSFLNSTNTQSHTASVNLLLRKQAYHWRQVIATIVVR